MARPNHAFPTIALVAFLALPHATPVSAQAVDGDAPLRIGFVIPSKTGEQPVRFASVNDITGEGALMGARQAESGIGVAMQKAGLTIDVLLANSPSVDAAARAARRLIEVDNVAALVGGIGDGQAETLSRIAAELEVPFFNIGATGDALRGTDCNRFTFHVEASDAMYLDAMAASSAAEGARSWFVLYEDTPAGIALLQEAEAAITSAEVGGAMLGSVAVPTAAPSYFGELRLAEASDADRIVVLLNPMDQMVLIQQQDSVGIETPTISLPSTLTQTRDYVAAVRYNAPLANPRHRIALWDTTLMTDGAGPFNEAYSARWGEPAEPTAWAAYAVVKLLADAALAAGSTAPADLVAYLEDPATRFDLLKSTEVSFRPWDHQMRQPLYDVVVDQEAEWARMSLPSRIGIAGVAGEIPPPAEGDPTAGLDRFGTTADESACRF